MRKMKHSYAFAIVFIVLSFMSHKVDAQFQLGFQFPSVNWGDNQGYTEDGKATGFKSPSIGSGFGIQGDFIIRPKIRVGLIIDIIGTQAQSSNILINNSGILTSEYINVSNSGSILRADFNYAFLHNFIDKGFNIYGLAGISSNGY